MRACVVRLILTVLFSVSILVNSWAQDTGKFRFEHLTVDDGLAHSDAMAVVQDKEGFVWVGTNNGINRYDGYELKKYDLPNDNSEGLSSNRIQALHVDVQGRLWAGAEGSGLYLYDQGKDCFTGIRAHVRAAEFDRLLALLTSNTVKSIHSDSKGILWLGTYDFGVFSLEFDQNNFVKNIKQISLGKSGKTNYTAWQVFSDNANRIWIATLGEGLWLFEPGLNQKTGKFEQAVKISNLPETDIRALYEDKAGKFWVASDNVVYLAKPQTNGKIAIDFQAMPHRFYGIQSLYTDTYNRMWVPTNFGLQMLDNAVGFMARPDAFKIHSFVPVDNDPHSINSGRVHQIVEDSFNNLWLAASSGGLNKLHLKPKLFHNLRSHSSTGIMSPNDYVNAIYKDNAQNVIWIGTRNGFSRYDLKSKTYKNYLKRKVDGNVASIDIASFLITENMVWVGTRYNGIYILDRNNPEKLSRLPDLKAQKSWYEMSIESMIQDENKTVWTATFGGGIQQFDSEGNYLRTFNTGNCKLPTNLFTFLLYDKETEVVWASTRDAGVLKLKEENGKLLVLNQFKFDNNTVNSLKVNFAWPLLKDKNGNIWIGTIGGGLHKLSKVNGKEIIERYQTWVPDNDIESLLIDKAGNIWIGGAGLSKFSPDSKAVLHYDVSDGLQSNSFKVGAAFNAADGTMYFGGTKGITYFKPEDILSNPSPPLVRIINFRVLSKGQAKNGGEIHSSMQTRSFSDKGGVTIKSSENDFSLEFVGLNYVNPLKQQYAYFLEGYSNEWIQLPAGQRVVSFANLPAGDYTFKVRANNGDGVWSKLPASLRLTILPPWYKTWWAYIGYSLLFVAAFLLYRRIAFSQLELKNRIALEKLKSEKEKEIAELKINFFTNVSHEFRTPLTLILGPMEEFMTSINESDALKQKVVMMHRQTKKLLDLVNQLLSFRKIESGYAHLSASKRAINSFLTEIFLIFKMKADERNLHYTLDLPDEEVMPYFDPEKLEVLITNLLSNAFKYTSAGGEIRFSASLKGHNEKDSVWRDGKLFDNYLEISVSDNGLGIKPEEIGKIFDPYYQASNAEAIPGKGTGIGLALVRQMVQSHSGEIEVKSIYGQGASFIVRLPLGRGHLSALDIVEEKAAAEYEVADVYTKQTLFQPEEQRSSKSLKIMIVEDHEDLRQYLYDLFEADYEVLTASEGLEGWDKVVQLQPDLVLSDVMMPGLNGLDLCKRIKENPKTLHIPVLLLTARAAAVQELEGLETGADDYISKPFNPRILQAKVHTVLQNRRKLRTYYQRQILLEPSDVTIPDEDRSFLETAMKVVEENLTNPDFNVQVLVSAMGMSQSVFYRKIKNITGQSVIEFIKDIRLKRAAQLLTNPNARISEIALMVGIEDPKNFRTSFQKLYNVSPSQYAKDHRAKGEINTV
ncbi:Signal transduction histidine kinase [Dyadobacter koreensis]|uniref:histidine kinase n=1 Tax=Dyadobacter koreensis TaxID=408657 RepID=A0A1H6VN32_9BACT|nr:two-component regulator propeller domain-containing protein [Dyadobacter koreensis]SEJ01505.1 Signal transduction histidine kinase [Dyadobacter koreensis]